MLGIGFEHAEELDAPLEGAPAHSPARSPMRSRRRTLLATLVGLTVLLVVVGWVVVPATVRDLPAQWFDVARQVLLFWVGLATLAWVMTSRFVARRVVGRATPGSLGAVRTIVCLALLGATLGERAGATAAVPASERSDDMGVMRLLYALPLGLDHLAASSTAMEGLKALTLALIFCAAIGWRTRFTLPAATLCWFVLAGVIRSHLAFTHNGIVPFYLLVILCFTRCADGFSVDRMLRVARGQSVVPSRARRATYAWGRYAVWAAVAMFYVIAGMSKLHIGGWMWWDGRNIQAILFSGAFRGFPWDFPIMRMDFVPTYVFSAMGLLTLATELGMILVLVSRRARVVMPLMALGMHAGIRAIQKIRFYDLMLLQLIFYDGTRVRRWVGERVRRRWGTLAVHLDAREPRAARAAELLRGCDLFELLEVSVAPQPFRAIRPRDGRESTGRDALAALSARVPILWPLAVALRLPLVGAAVYALAARVWERYARFPEPAAPAPLARAPRPFAWPIVVPALALLLVGCCLYTIDQFPFTSMRMYARSNHSGIHTYTRLLMTTAAGETQPVYLNRFGGTVKRFNYPMDAAFRDEEGGAARKRLAAKLQDWGASVNRNARPDQRVVRLEAQKVRWDFINHRHDPNYGRVADRLVVDLAPSRQGESVARGR